jgi:hypothetical protein
LEKRMKKRRVEEEKGDEPPLNFLTGFVNDH